MSESLLIAPSQMSFQEILKRPLPHQTGHKFRRMLMRGVTWFAKRAVVSIEGNAELLRDETEPFIVVFNHNQRLEAVFLPTLLFFYRGGKLIHFMADWNFLMVPGVGTLYRQGETIIVTNKDAKPKFLNFMKRFFRQEGSAYERAYQKLKSGGSLGLFPEGTMNRDPDRMMRGFPGAARLAIKANVPVLPVGIRFPQLLPGQVIPDGAVMSLHVGESIAPPAASYKDEGVVKEHHARIMTRLSELCGKSWHPQANKRRRYVS